MNKAKKPRRPCSAFLFYSKHVRPRFTEEFPNLHPAMLSKIIGARWGSLSEEERKPFDERHQAAKKNFEMQMQLLEPEKPANKRKNREPGRPKKPLTAFFLFSQDARKNGQVSTSELGARWNNFTKEERQPYHDKSERLRAQYNAEMEAFLKKTYPDNPERWHASAGTKSKKKAKKEHQSHGPGQEMALERQQQGQQQQVLVTMAHQTAKREEEQRLQRLQAALAAEEESDTSGSESTSSSSDSDDSDDDSDDDQRD
eukprot:m.113824 g.113824  ORF g.113824 m.113824 type:complete len:257 (+) comp22897_c0_seq2:62-832(+)